MSAMTAESVRTLAPTEARGKYVYCIVETDRRLELGPLGIGDGRSPVYTVHCGDLAAIVSDAPLESIDPTRDNLLAHELVSEAAGRDHTVLPMSFGTVFGTEADVVELLRTTGTAFRDVLDCIRGKVELGLKVVWDRERVLAEIQAENEAIRHLMTRITRDDGGSTYFARIQLARLVEAALEERASRIVAQVHETLGPHSVAVRPNRLLGDNMILSAAFLIRRSDQDAFDEAVEGLGHRYGPDLSIRYTGPWPPHNFVNIQLKLERVD